MSYTHILVIFLSPHNTEGLHYGLGDVPEVAGLVVGLQEGGRHLSARVRGVEVVSLLHA
jgi:hypothetical protein